MAQTATELTVQRLENLAADKTVSPPVMRRGLVAKASDGTYYNVPGTTDGFLRTVAGGTISTVNSTTSTLNADAAFTGTAEDITNVSSIIVSLKASHASATDGLSVQFSPDGTNWDNTDVFTIPAVTGKTFSFQPAAQYFRVVYTNGGTNQTSFRLQTVFKYTNVKPSSHRIQDAIVDEDDAELVTSVLKAKANGGGYVNIGATESENLRVTDAESGLAIAMGNVTGTTNVNKFGNAIDFDTGDNEVDIWDGADDSTFGGSPPMNYTFSATADIDTITSSNGGDTQDIEIQGLDTNWALVTQTTTLNGQTDVTLTTPLIRVFRMKNIGSSNIAGDVWLRTNGSGQSGGVPTTANTVRARIDNGNNQTEMAIYSVPAGKTAYIRELYASTAGGSRATNYIIKLKIRPFGQVFQLKHRRAINDDKDLEKKFDTPEKATEKSDIIVTAQAEASAITGSSLSAGFDVVIVDN